MNLKQAIIWKYVDTFNKNVIKRISQSNQSNSYIVFSNPNQHKLYNFMGGFVLLAFQIHRSWHFKVRKGKYNEYIYHKQNKRVRNLQRYVLA